MMRETTKRWLLVCGLVAGAGIAACGDDGAGGGKGPIAPPEGEVPLMGMRRLTVHEYNRTLRDLIGDDSDPASTFLPEDYRDPFDNDYRSQAASRALVEGAEILANEAAARLIADPARRDALIGCAPTGPDDADCMQRFIADFGRLALRHALSDDEVASFYELAAADAAAAGDFFAGAELVVRALLQDAELLYRIERGTPVPGHVGMFQLDGYEIATRMSYLVWGTTPDDALLDAAEAGDLDTSAGRADAAASMLSDPRARVQIDRFHALWLGYDQLPHPPEITDAMRRETAALVERVVFDEDAPWTDLFMSTETFIDDALAAHYGLPAPGSSEPVWTDVSSQGRQGILSHGSFLSVASNIGDTSPVRRGKAIRELLMCSPIPPPPPGVNIDKPPEVGECKIDQYAAHASGSCATCHQHMDPIGFGLENYDVAGRYRDHDDGKPQCVIAGDGELAGVGTFNGPAELSQLLVDNVLIQGCAVQHLVQYALGRELDDADMEWVAALTETFGERDERFGALIAALVGDDTFGFRSEEP